MGRGMVFAECSWGVRSVILLGVLKPEKQRQQIISIVFQLLEQLLALGFYGHSKSISGKRGMRLVDKDTVAVIKGV